MPRISVVIPVYNVEAYLAEAIDSVIGQDVGFGQIEIILVDDGSTDNSSEICKRYVAKYPRHISYIRQKNGGVSRARNAGLRAARGQYVHFFDGDDCLSKNFYSTALKFLETQADVDFVAAKIKFFDAAIDSHPLNYKFSRSRVIDLAREPDSPLLHVITCVFRADRIRDVRFDEKLSVSEDVKFLGDVLLDKQKYGVVTRSTYHYRKRGTASSAIGGKERNKSYYLATPARVYQHLLDTWQSAGTAYAAYTVLYDMSYRLRQKTAPVLTPAERRSYQKTIHDVLKTVDDEVVMAHRFLSVHEKAYVLRIKYGRAFQDYLRVTSWRVYFRDFLLYDCRNLRAHLDFVERQGDAYKIEGYIAGYLAPSAGIALNVGGRMHRAVRVPRAQREASFMGDVYYDGGAFEAVVPLRPGKSVQIVVDGRALPLEVRRFTRLAAYAYSYRRDAGRLVGKKPRKITIHSYSWPLHVLFEFRQLLLILMHWKLTVFWQRFRQMRTRNFAHLSWKARILELAKPSLFTLETVCLIPRAFILRAAYYVGRLLQRRPLWIVSDRGMAAGDNGEAFFRYVLAQPDCPAKVYFALSKKSSDYARLRVIGPVLNYGSLRYKYKFLLASKIISSHADVEVTNPFRRQLDHFADLLTFDFIFLQHGIIRNDLSGWLNRFEKNIAAFVTSAQKEYDSIVRYPYYYAKERVLLSGMPRYDNLENKPQGKVVLTPTYRGSLLRLPTDKYGVRPYDDQFKHSEYCRFYNRLMNDRKVLAAMKSAGLTGEFYVHPNFAAQTRDFSGNEVFTVQSYPYDYQRAISEGSLLISDYSSVALDFAYLRKPIIYAQFDANTFFAGHSFEKGDFFSDETDGFGPVTHTYDELVQQLLEHIGRRNRPEPKYVRRAEKFFAHHDQRNSARVYRALVAGKNIH